MARYRWDREIQVGWEGTGRMTGEMGRCRGVRGFRWMRGFR